jgi:2-polyprenyl-3-methyl-5-hydroxy-6-metoxy-1,4-benzoquinol methylase
MTSDYDPVLDGSRLQLQAVITADAERALLASLVCDQPFTLLDVGCAQGELSVARIAGLHCVGLAGVDSSAGAVETARALHPGHHWQIGTQDDELEPADIVWSSLVVQHVDNPAAFITRCYDLVRPGGHLVVAFPDDRHKVLTPRSATLDWLLASDFRGTGVAGSRVSDRRVSEKVFDAAVGLDGAVEIRLLQQTNGRATVELVDVDFGWRLAALARSGSPRLAEAQTAVDGLRELAGMGRCLLLDIVTAIIVTKPA